jgi:hypothetical protein
MDPERRRQLKRAGKAEVERRSAELNAAMSASNPAPVGSEEWGRGYKSGTERERWLRVKLPVLHRPQLESLFVVLPQAGAGWVAHPGGYVQCLKCGSAVPSAMPRRLFYWSGCACGNIRWRWLFFRGRATVADAKAVVPVTLVGKS